MRFTLRLKLFAIVAVAGIALVVLAVASGISERAVAHHVDSIRDTYLPKIRLRPQLESAFEQLGRTIQNAVEASDAEALALAVPPRDALLKIVDGASDALTADQRAALQVAIDDYYQSAAATSRRLISGGGGEAIAGQVQEMQAKRTRVETLIDQTTAFDERELDAAFAAAENEEHGATRARVVVGGLCLAMLLAISLWIGAGVLGNLRALIAGFERFGKSDFATPIRASGSDELGEVAERANRMAAQLQELDRDRASHEWISAGLVGLSDELRGELEPREVADRTLAFLARYVGAPVGALYHGPPGGPYALLGTFAVADGLAPASFAAGEGLVGQAVLRSTITVADTQGNDALTLRSGLVDARPRASVLVPLHAGGPVTGVLELASIKPWRPADSDLLAQASRIIEITIDSAKRRVETRDLLEQTRMQARELERVGVALEQRAADLAKASAYKSQFLANMSHELRTPLNAIIGFSELMYDGTIPLDEETTHEYLGDVLTSGRHLLQLINDVLDLAKVEAGKLEFHPEPVRLSRVIAEVLAVLRTTSAKQQIEVATDVAPEVEELVLDAGRLKQVLYNYLSNALKFTPPRGTIIVRARPEGADRFRLEVQDSGIGIPADELGRLFGEFEQTGAGARKSGGTGLGLALTKRLVEAQRGEVGVRSQPGAGSTFHAVLPRRAGDGAPAPSTLQVIRAAGDARTILVVEDEPGDRDRLVVALAAAGYAVDAVSTGAEAIARCAEHTYDAITLDLLLPDMTGLEILQKLREGRNGTAPVIVVTVVAERGAVAGFAVHDVLAKPLAESALLASLSRAGVSARDDRAVVLVVDDDPASLKVMAATLARLGYIAVTESDPARGLRMATEEPPAAIVLDLLMPGMTGFDFLTQFRKVDTARHVPVIVWTSKDLSAEEHARLRSSANAVVSKGHEGNARVLAELAAILPLDRARSA